MSPAASAPQSTRVTDTVGFELELMAPAGSSRRALAFAVAARVRGAVEVGFKYVSEGLYKSSRRPICDLSLAWRVKDADGRLVCDLVDDVTLRSGLDGARPAPSDMYRVVMDDLRLALWLERHAWRPDADPAGPAPSPEYTLAHLCTTFDGSLGAPGARGAGDPAHRVATDPYGHALAVVAKADGERERPCELVTRPLTHAERAPVLRTLLEAAADLGFTVPDAAALHVHLDAAPWKSTPRLKALIADFSAARPLLRREWQTNLACKRLGPWPAALTQAAAGLAETTPFEEARAALWACKPSKYADLNLLGLLRDPPRHPTLEVRALPMTLDPDAVLGKLGAVEDFLAGVLDGLPPT